MSDTTLSVDEVAARLGCSRATAWRRIHSGELPAGKYRPKPGYALRTRVKEADLEAFIKGEANANA